MEKNNPSRKQFLRTVALLVTGFACTSNLFAQRKPLATHLPAIVPPRLKRGDTVALTAPAGAIFNEETIEKTTRILEDMGFRIQHGKTLHLRQGYLAGTDAERANELHELFVDQRVRGIIAMRGGWGCARLLSLLDWKKLLMQPKIVSGFSDITTLLLALRKQTGLITFHGPVGNSSWEEFTREQFLRVTTDPLPPLLQQPETDPLTVINAGVAEGILYGGNLSVLCSLIGTDYLPDLSDALLLLEETEEEPYTIDRLLTQLQLSGILNSVAGIVFGKCSKCEAEDPDKSFTLEEVLRQKLSSLKIPVVSGFSFGHTKDKFTLPIGVRARLDTEKGQIQILDPVVQ
jgi:muramoyltetrapeptide carboxypeptidase